MTAWDWIAIVSTAAASGLLVTTLIDIVRSRRRRQ